jgi:hypothetical protein
LTCTTTSGGKTPGPARAGTFLQAGKALVEEALAPEGDDFTAGPELLSNLIVRQPVGCKQHHLGTLDHKIR